MTVTVHQPTGSPPRERRPGRTADLLVVGGSLVAPLDLLIVRALTVYDVLIFAAFVLAARQGRLRWPARRYLAMAYVFTLAALLSAFRATYPIEALAQVLQYAFIFFVQIPVVLGVVRTRRRVVVSLLLLLVGTLGAIWQAQLFPQTQAAGRNLVFYSENPNRLGYPAAYVLPFLLVFWRLSRGQGGLRRLGVLLGCAWAVYLSLWALFASGSRSSLFGTAVALVVLVVLRPDLGLARRTGHTLVLVGAVTALIVGLVGTGQMPTTLEERVTRTVSAEDTEDSAGLVGDRVQLARAAGRAIVESPYLGTGLDNFRYVSVDYNVDATPQVPHNLWLQLMTQVGFFGAAAFAGILLLWFADMVRTVRHTAAPDRELAWGSAASLAGFLTIFMFAPEMLDRHYWLIFALGLAVATGGVRLDNHLGGKT